MEEEREQCKAAYDKDSHFSKVLQQLRKEGTIGTVLTGWYQQEADGLLYFQDNMGNLCLCVPSDLIKKIISEDHDTITEGAHRGFHKTYNQIAAKYYWPSMS
jgi:hypothetical protein